MTYFLPRTVHDNMKAYVLMFNIIDAINLIVGNFSHHKWCLKKWHKITLVPLSKCSRINHERLFT